MRKAGLGVASITYDPEVTLKHFAEAHHIAYPMLSDQGSVVIRKFGLQNMNIPEGNLFYGMPFPGCYVLAPDGTVTDKHFLPNYQTRPTASGILLADFGVVGSRGSVTIGAEDVRAKISLSSAKTVPGQELGAALEITIAPGWHIYGEPLPKNYVATSVVFSGDAVAKQSWSLPPATPLEFRALGETLPVYAGTVRGKGTILISGRVKPGEDKVSGILKFQECNDEICKLPQQVPFEIPIMVEQMVPGLKK